MRTLLATAVACLYIPALAAAEDVGIRSNYGVGDISVLCQSYVMEAKAGINQIAALLPEQRNFQNTVLAFETTMAVFNSKMQPMTYMSSVARDPQIRHEALACDGTLSDFNTNTSSRRDLYNALKDQVGSNADEKRLVLRTLQGFEQAGMKLPDAQLDQVRQLMLKLQRLQLQFGANLTEDKTTIAVDALELKGVNPKYLASLKKQADGRYIVNTRESDYMEVMTNATSSHTRQLFYVAYNSRGAQAGNMELLQQAVELRHQIANLMGYPAWSDVQLIGRMAKSTTIVDNFLSDLQSKLRERNLADNAQLLAYAKEIDPSLTTLNPWDQSYYANQLKKRNYGVDNDKVREYFPADVVISGIFDVYSQILGVNYNEVVGAAVWDPSVKLYSVTDKKDGRLIGHFYTDFYARTGKYNHAAAANLIAGRVLPNGQYNHPLSSIVANVAPPVNGQPALLPHTDVITIFHEFGHVMHGVLTRAPYASLAGTAVARDFVEAPSQMLENWPWEPAVLAKISGHYLDHSQKLPQELLQKMLNARDFQQGMFYTRQLVFATYDMSLHGADLVTDVGVKYDQIYAALTGMRPVPGTSWPAGFGHIMGGYDAGYYSYLWSKVYAEDMFTVFKDAGVLSPVAGAHYRKTILERGDMEDAIDLVNRFLGRSSNSDAFFKMLHLLGS